MINTDEICVRLSSYVYDRSPSLFLTLFSSSASRSISSNPLSSKSCNISYSISDPGSTEVLISISHERLPVSVFCALVNFVIHNCEVTIITIVKNCKIFIVKKIVTANCTILSTMDIWYDNLFYSIRSP